MLVGERDAVEDKVKDEETLTTIELETIRDDEAVDDDAKSIWLLDACAVVEDSGGLVDGGMGED